MKKFLLILASSLALSALTFAPAFAQGAAPTGRPTDPAAQARMKAMQPIFDLTGRVTLMTELDAQPKLKFTSAQAKLLLPVLKDLQSRAGLTAPDATAILTKIEDKILTDAQVTWLDDTQLKRAEERRQRMQNGGGGGGQGTGGTGAPGGRTGGAPGGRGGFFQAMQSGKPFNPFKLDDRAGKSLTDLIALLAKR